jgi:hypothetical protein
LKEINYNIAKNLCIRKIKKRLFSLNESYYFFFFIIEEFFEKCYYLFYQLIEIINVQSQIENFFEKKEKTF